MSGATQKPVFEEKNGFRGMSMRVFDAIVSFSKNGFLSEYLDSSDSMNTKTYRAGTMKDALAKVRHDLGGDAMIVNTREVRRRRLFGLGRRELIEVTAVDSRTQSIRLDLSSGTSSSFHAEFSE